MREYEQTIGRAHTIEVGGGIIYYPLEMKASLFTLNCSPVGGAIGAEATIVYSRKTSLKVNTQALNPAIGDYARGGVTVGLRGSTRVHVDYKFQMGTGCDTEGAGFVMNTYLVPDQSTMGIRWNGQQGKFEYIDSAGSWVAMAHGAVALNVGTWYRVSALLDLNKCVYEEVVVNGIAQLNKAVDGQLTANATTAAQCEFYLEATVMTAAQCTAYFDELVITEAV